MTETQKGWEPHTTSDHTEETNMKRLKPCGKNKLHRQKPLVLVWLRLHCPLFFLYDFHRYSLGIIEACPKRFRYACKASLERSSFQGNHESSESEQPSQCTLNSKVFLRLNFPL